MTRCQLGCLVAFVMLPFSVVFADTLAREPVTATVWVGLLKEVVSLAVAIAAGIGLLAWRTQQRKAHDFDVARQVLKSVLVLRDAIRSLRMKIGYGNEDERGRFGAIVDATSQFEAAFLEAEVLWSAEMNIHRRQLRNLIQKIQLAAQDIQSVREAGLANSGVTASEVAEARRVRWGVGSSNDEFWMQVSATIEAVEEAVRPKLRW